jgi:hypothetical protein
MSSSRPHIIRLLHAFQFPRNPSEGSVLNTIFSDGSVPKGPEVGMRRLYDTSSFSLLHSISAIQVHKLADVQQKQAPAAPQLKQARVWIDAHNTTLRRLISTCPNPAMCIRIELRNNAPLLNP